MILHTDNSSILGSPDLVWCQLGGQVQGHKIVDAGIDLLQVGFVFQCLFRRCHWRLQIGLGRGQLAHFAAKIVRYHDIGEMEATLSNMRNN